MTVRRYAGRALLAAAVVAATIGGTAVAAQAAAAPSVDVQANRLVLEPGLRGYHGSIAVTVTYQGDQPDYANLWIVEPVPGAFRSLRPAEACMINPQPDGRSRYACGVPRGPLQPGESRRFRIDFEVLTANSEVAMSAPATQIEVSLSGDPSVQDSTTSRTLFRSVFGSVRNPVPYVQDTRSNMRLSAFPTTLTRQEDGTYEGRVPVILAWNGDAPHSNLSVALTFPDGVSLNGIEPSDVCGGTWCVVPGGPVMEGERRAFDLVVTAPADTPAGALGSGTVTGRVDWFTETTDVDPSDDTASFALSIA